MKRFFFLRFGWENKERETEKKIRQKHKHTKNVINDGKIKTDRDCFTLLYKMIDWTASESQTQYKRF